jgi:hypothetical protein
MKQAKTDPLASCPIVCGEHLRASGFFFRADEGIYLITAKHNVLPTNGELLRTGNIDLNFVIEDVRPTIDVYLKMSDGFETKRLDIRGETGIIRSPEIDVIAVPFPYDPAEYGYQVWTESDISSPVQSPAVMDSIGFNRETFPDPDDGYDADIYSTEITKPVCLQLENEWSETMEKRDTGVMAHGIDETFVGDESNYNGLSGSPILGDGLVGIHSNTTTPPSVTFEDYDEFLYIMYTRAEVLPHMLS